MQVNNHGLKHGKEISGKQRKCEKGRESQREREKEISGKQGEYLGNREKELERERKSKRERR